MEHRWHTRIPTALDVMVYHHRVPVAACKARNISRDGMFVEAGPLSFYRNTSVDLEFQLGSHGGGRRLRIPALVVHTEGGGMGLVFQVVTEDQTAALQDFISQSMEMQTPLAQAAHQNTV